jgi:ATP-binding cassette, subfamily B, multidrug efflux pump
MGLSSGVRGEWPDWRPGSRPALAEAFRSRSGTVVLIVGLGILSVGLNIAATLLLARAIDRVVGEQDQMADAARLCGAAITAYAAGGVLWITQGRVTTRFVHELAHRIRLGAHSLIRATPLVELERFGPADIHARLVNDVENLTRALQSSVSQASNSLLLTIGLIAAMVSISPLLASVTVATVAVGVVVTRWLTRRARPRYVAEFGSLGTLNSAVIEWLGADETTRLMLQRARHAEVLDGLAVAAQRDAARAQRVGGLAQPASLVLSYGGYVAVILVGVRELAAGRVSVGEVQAMLLYARQVSGPLVQLASLANVVQSGLASWHRVADLGVVRSEVASQDEQPAAPAIRSVERLAIEGARLRYTDDGPPALDDVDLVLERGEVVFLIGETGSGKSSLAALLAGLHQPQVGRTWIEGDGQRHPVRQQVCLVPQDAYLFHGTVADNLAAGRAPLPAHDLESAATWLGLSRLIGISGNRLATSLEAGGRPLGLSRRQAVSLLRAYCDERHVVVLDEATSSLDVATEAQVINGFRERCRNGILVVVAHRHDGIRDTDRVVEVANGSIVRDGLRGTSPALAGRH